MLAVLVLFANRSHPRAPDETLMRSEFIFSFREIAACIATFSAWLILSKKRTFFNCVILSEKRSHESKGPYRH